MCYHSQKLISVMFLYVGFSFRKAGLLLMKETQGFKGTKGDFLFIIFLNQTIYNSIEQWRAKKNKHYSIGFVFSFYSSFSLSLSLFFKLNIRTTFKMNRFFLKQHSFFNTYEEFGRFIHGCRTACTHYPEGSWVSCQQCSGRVRQSYLGLTARTLGSKTFGTKKSILFCFVFCTRV